MLGPGISCHKNCWSIFLSIFHLIRLFHSWDLFLEPGCFPKSLQISFYPTILLKAPIQDLLLKSMILQCAVCLVMTDQRRDVIEQHLPLLANATNIFLTLQNQVE